MNAPRKPEKSLHFIGKHLSTLLILLGILLIAGASFFSLLGRSDPSQVRLSLFEEKVEGLHATIFAEGPPENFLRTVDAPNQLNIPHAVFFSVSDSLNRAWVFTGTGESLAEAWEDGVHQAGAFIQQHPLEPQWVKVDLVDHVEEVDTAELTRQFIVTRSEFFRKGISFDRTFTQAFLEAELNGNQLINYAENRLDMDMMNRYLEPRGREAVQELPDNMLLFTCKGWFMDETNAVHELYGYEGEGYNYGRRILQEFNRDVVEEVMLSAAAWLSEEVQEDGSFHYGYFPIFHRSINTYNLLRHTLAVQSLIWEYTLTEEASLLPKIESTLHYLTEDHIEFVDEETAFVIDRPNDEVKLGGNGLAIITLKLYMDTFETDRYVPLSEALGNGILRLMNQEEGTFYHVLHTDFTPKEAFRIIYYDGEATYALAILYELTGDEKWLSAATAAVEHFIEEDYTRYQDHWVAYAVNEVTKHVDDPRYYEFGLRNVQENLYDIHHRDTTFHTYLELLMAGYELYHRMMELDIHVDYLADFDHAFFFDTIFHRAEHMLNGFLYPEYSMYLQHPGAVTGTFCTRHDRYRIRIDDVEHFIAGYYNFWQYYPQLKVYQETFSE